MQEEYPGIIPLKRTSFNFSGSQPVILLSFRIFFLFLFAFGKAMEATASPAEVRKMDVWGQGEVPGEVPGFVSRICGVPSRGSPGGAGGAGIVGLHCRAWKQWPVFEEHIEIASTRALGSEKTPQTQPGSPPVARAGFYPKLLSQEAFSPPWASTCLSRIVGSCCVCLSSSVTWKSGG